MFNRYAVNFLKNHVLSSSNDAFNKKIAEDPTVVGFNLIFTYGKDSPLLNMNDGDGENAREYLERLGERDKVSKVIEFGQRLRDLTQITPYFFRKITGLDEIYKLEPGMSYDKERKLTISTYESIDQRIGSLANLYSEFCYDFVNRRMTLPINMRRFEVIVLVSEIRNYRTVAKRVVAATDAIAAKTGQVSNVLGQIGGVFGQVGGGLGQASDIFGKANTVDFIDLNPYIDVYAFKFKNCEFDFSGTNDFVNASNEAPEVAENSFSIKCGNFENLSRVGLFDLDRPLGQEPNANLLSNTLANAQSNQPLTGIFSKDQDNKNLGQKSLGDPSMDIFQRKENEILSAIGIPVVSQVISEKFFNVINAKVKQFQFGNVFYRSNKLDIGAVIDGRQQPADLLPTNGRNPIADYSKSISNEILNYQTLNSSTEANRNYAKEQILKVLNATFGTQNVQQKQSLLENIVLSSLGQIQLI